MTTATEDPRITAELPAIRDRLRAILADLDKIDDGLADLAGRTDGHHDDMGAVWDHLGHARGDLLRACASAAEREAEIDRAIGTIGVHHPDLRSAIESLRKALEHEMPHDCRVKAATNRAIIAIAHAGIVWECGEATLLRTLMEPREADLGGGLMLCWSEDVSPEEAAPIIAELRAKVAALAVKS